MRKRIVCILLVCCVLFTMLPTVAFAETVATELPQQYKSGYIIRTFCTDADAAPMYQAQMHE